MQNDFVCKKVLPAQGKGQIIDIIIILQCGAERNPFRAVFSVARQRKARLLPCCACLRTQGESFCGRRKVPGKV